MNCLNTVGAGINNKKVQDVLSLNGYKSGISTSWTATIDGSMKLKVVGGAGHGGVAGQNTQIMGGGGGGGGGSGYNSTTNFAITKGNSYSITIGTVPGGTSIFNNSVYAYGGGNGSNGSDAGYNPSTGRFAGKQGGGGGGGGATGKGGNGTVSSNGSAGSGGGSRSMTLGNGGGVGGGLKGEPYNRPAGKGGNGSNTTTGNPGYIELTYNGVTIRFT